MITKRSLALLSFLWTLELVAMYGWAQNQVGPITIGETIQLQSNILKEPRSLLISKPSEYNSGTERYPVLYLLDGETHFHYTSGIVNFLAEEDRIPGMLVVGIPSGDMARRTHDLTPLSTDEMDNRFAPGNGGADAFLAFIADEVIPYVEKTYRTRPYRLLVGHSLGGLFGIYALSTRPRLFNGYIVADPSLYWNNDAVVTQAQSLFSRTKELEIDMYVTVSGDSEEVPDAIRTFNSLLSEKSTSGVRWNFDWMKQENHLSIPLPGILRGLQTIFEEWHLPDSLALYDKGGIQAIHRRFQDAGKRFGYPERRTPPFAVSLAVAKLLDAGRLEDAAKVLLDDVAAYPPPWNQLEALARAYDSRGDTEQATRYYLMSLRANPRNEFARKKLVEKGVRELPKE